MRAVTAAAASSMVSPCSLKLHETRELTLRFEEEGRLASETSHAGIIRIGFEGISQPHFVEHPCFNNQIETLPAPRLQIRAEFPLGMEVFHCLTTSPQTCVPSH